MEADASEVGRVERHQECAQLALRAAGVGGGLLKLSAQRRWRGPRGRAEAPGHARERLHRSFVHGLCQPPALTVG